MPENITGLFGLFTSALVSSTIAPGGSEVLLALMASSSDYSSLSLLVTATVGNTLGAMTTMLLGSMAARKFSLSVMLPKNKQTALEWVKKHGVWTLLLSWLPIIGDAFCFAAGWLKLPWLPALTALLVGKLARYAVIVWLVT